MLSGGTELQFADGRFVVPDHVASLLSRVDTSVLRYEQAMDSVNARLMGEHIGAHEQTVLREHFAKLRGSR